MDAFDECTYTLEALEHAFDGKINAGFMDLKFKVKVRTP
jgi:hypothetical protein